MTPRVLLGTADVPGGPPLKLFRRGDDFTIALDRNDLMSSRMSGSEAALGTMALDRLDARPGGRGTPRFLIGGYGMGFTLRALLAVLPPDACAVVAELVPGIVEWARGPMAALTDGCLDDPRVDLRIADVAAEIATPGAGYDAVLLDVDNGPDGLTRPGNDGLYGAEGLARARAALRPGGVLAVWSAAPDAAFTRRLARAGFAVDEVRLRARANGKGPMHVIWFGTRR